MASFAFTAFIIASWYGSNIAVLLLNKYLLTTINFRYPVFLSLCHMLACSSLGGLLSLNPQYATKPIKNIQQFWKIAALSVLFCLSIVCGNASLKYLPVSFNQAVGSSTPFFTAIFAFAIQGVRESIWTYLTLVPVAAGVVVASGGEPLFHWLGFMLCISATAARAMKSVIQAILMSDPSDKLDPMSLLVYMATFSMLLLLPTALILEFEAFLKAHALVRADFRFLIWLLVNSSMAYLVNLTNFLVTKYTSALTLQVLGNAKGAVASVVSVSVFHNPVTWTGVMGYTTTMLGVLLYSETKKAAAAAKKAEKAEKTDAENPSDPEIKTVTVNAKDGLREAREPLLKGYNTRQ